MGHHRELGLLLLAGSSWLASVTRDAHGLHSGLVLAVVSSEEYTPAPGLGDVPIAGGKLQYLDGTWQATCVAAPPPPPSRNGSCTFEANVDLDAGNLSHAGMMSAKDQAECCFLCWNRAGCAAAVSESLKSQA